MEKFVKLGWRILAPRRKKGWIQSEMAAYLEMNRGHLPDVDPGKREAGLITLQIIATGLGTTMSKSLRGL